MNVMTETILSIKERAMHLLLLSLIVLLAMLPGSSVSDNRVQYTSGFIAAVGIEVDEQGHPMLAEYDSDGRFVADVGYLGLGELENVTLYPASSWRAFEQFQTTVFGANPDGQLMSADQYNSRSFMTRGSTPETVIKPELLPGTRSVFVIAEDRMLTTTPQKEGFILAEYPVALHQEDTNITGQTVSLILGQQGEVVRASNFDISFKASVYKEGGRRANRSEDRLWQPIPNVRVSAGDADFNLFPGGQTVSGEDGRYTMTYALPPCPGFSYMMDVPIIATLDIENFNPKNGGELGFISAIRNDPKVCVGYGDVSLGLNPLAISAQLDAQAIVATLANPIYHLDVRFSTMQLNAIGTLTNQTVDGDLDPVRLALSGPTVYTEDSQTRRLRQEEYRFDFNLDGVDDIAVINPENADQIDIYYSPNEPTNEDGEPNPPDFTRLADNLQFSELDDNGEPVEPSQLDHQGLLSEISQQDLEETDVYIYRRSTGQRLGSIEGLATRDEEGGGAVVNGNPANPSGRATYRGVHTEEENATFGFTSFLVGAVSNDLRSDSIGAGFETAARRRPWLPTEGTAGGFTTENSPDGLRPGETVQVIAINRATGYIGSQEIVIQPSGTTLEPPQPIEMGPPNLKVIASREFEDFNELTRSSDPKINIIGSEGAGLTSDTYVKIQSVWLAQNGDVLPDDLPGYTGRLAISTGSSTRDFSGNFEIKPGYQTQVVQLNNAADLTTEHFYMQVIGEHINGNPTFESPGAGEGRLQTRPKKYVPILVPLFDETSTRAAKEALSLARLEGVENLPNRVEPTYRWAYRPEMQFSVYELQRQRLEFVDQTGAVQTIDLTEVADFNIASTLTSGLDFVELLYDLGDPNVNALNRFGGDPELLFSIGGEEAIAAIDSNGVVRFDNPEHISLLEDIDLFAIRLYANNDLANVLWEYSFDNLGVYTSQDDELNEAGGEFFLISADEPYLELEAALLSYVTGTNESDELAKIIWESVGAVDQIAPESTTNETGVSRTMVTLPPVVGASAIVSASHFESGLKTDFPEIVVIPGDPYTIDLNVIGEAYTRGVGELTAEATVRDKNGNAVLGGTAIVFAVEGDAYVTLADSTVNENGIARVKIKGGEYVGASNKIVAYVDQIQASATFGIQGVDVEIQNAPDTVVAGDSATFTVRAFTPQGPAVDIPVDLSTTSGLFRTHSNFTNAEGEVVISWYAPIEPGSVEIKACAQSTQCLESHTIEVLVDSDAAPQQLGMRKWLVGDQTIDGQVDVARYDGTIVSNSYFAQVPLSIKGQPDTTESIAIGSPSKPNRPLILNWPMTQMRGVFVVDANGNRPTYSQNVKVSYKPGERRSFSYRFSGDSKIELQDNDTIKPEAVAFRIEIKPESMAAKVVDLDEALVLSLSASGEAVLTAKTSEGEFSINSVPLPDDQWHTIAVTFDGAEITLKVSDETTVKLSTQGTLAYNSGNLENDSSGLVIGEGFQGQMRNFIFYNPSSDPLIHFTASGGESYDVSYDSNGDSVVQLQTLGNLGPTAIQQVEFRNPNESVGSILLASSNSIRKLLSMSAALTSTSPSFDSLYSLQEQAIEYGDPGYVAAHFVGATLDKIATTNLDALSTILASVTVLPDGEKYRDHLLKLQQFFAESGNDSAILAAADSLGEPVKQALNGNFEAYRKTQLGLLVLAETIDQSQVSKQTIAQGIKSKQDFDAWIDFLTLPSEGWIGYKPPVPRLDSDCNEVVPLMSVGTGLSLPAVTCRLTGKKVAAIIDLIAADNSAEITANPSKLPVFLREFVDALPNADMFFRRYALSVDPDAVFAQRDSHSFAQNAHAAVPIAALIGLLARVGLKATFGAVKNVIAFALGKTNSRINPVLYIAAMVYLETRMSENCNAPDCAPIAPDLHDKVRSTQKLFAINMLYNGRFSDETKKQHMTCKIWEGTHGKMFEVAMIAYFHAMFEFFERDDLEIVDLQRKRKIELIKKDPSGNKVKYSDFGRDYDIVLAGNSTTADAEDEQIIVEIKSAQARYSRPRDFNVERFDNRFPVWSVLERVNKEKNKSRSTTVHRQLVLDNVASNEIQLPNGEIQRWAKDYVWVWHDWKQRRKYKGRSKDPGVSIWDETHKGRKVGDYLRERMQKIASTKSGSDIIATTLDITTPSLYKYPLRGRVRDVSMQRFDEFNWLNILASEEFNVKEKILAQLDSETVEELERLEELAEEIRDAEEQLEKAKEYIREAISEFLNKPEWLEEMEETRDDLEEQAAEYLEAIDNYTLDKVVPDSIVNNCL